MSAARAIPVLRCSAAGIPVGLAAGEVAEFTAGDTATVPSLAGLLGLVASPKSGSERTLRLQAPTTSASVRVEGPVHIRPVTGTELLAMPRLLAGAGMGPVIGFLEEGGQVVVLLDVPGLVDLAQRSARTPGNEETPW